MKIGISPLFPWACLEKQHFKVELLFQFSGLHLDAVETYRIVSSVILGRVHDLKYLKPFLFMLAREIKQVHVYVG